VVLYKFSYFVVPSERGIARALPDPVLGEHCNDALHIVFVNGIAVDPNETSALVLDL
jgi:hypothetical protein